MFFFEKDLRNIEKNKRQLIRFEFQNCSHILIAQKYASDIKMK